MIENDIADIVVPITINIHRQFGPGLLESVYEAILAKELNKKGLSIVRQAEIPLNYEGDTIDLAFRADIIVEGKVIHGLKATEKNSPVYKRQLLTYLKLTDIKLGLLLNFGMEVMKNGIERVINGKLSSPCPRAPV